MTCPLLLRVFTKVKETVGIDDIRKRYHELGMFMNWLPLQRVSWLGYNKSFSRYFIM
ncbi:hypothetical protein RchiOBHm_Chr5g0036271 [Rosa chinensis]|uniref:Uncharacterized protein n=1 Tax=Rosa chinensis TaxID=74649 RepID=A0A2P6QBG1_ROSCH|nr:hypothetical protein RchiOBHm_Chr5g0036271 [Rosa chinensis]